MAVLWKFPRHLVGISCVKPATDLNGCGVLDPDWAEMVPTLQEETTKQWPSPKKNGNFLNCWISTTPNSRVPLSDLKSFQDFQVIKWCSCAFFMLFSWSLCTLSGFFNCTISNLKQRDGDCYSISCPLRRWCFFAKQSWTNSKTKGHASHMDVSKTENATAQDQKWSGNEWSSKSQYLGKFWRVNGQRVMQ